MTRKPLMSSSFISAANRVRIRNARAWVEIGPLLKSCSSSPRLSMQPTSLHAKSPSGSGPRLRRPRLLHGNVTTPLGLVHGAL